jgi:hypothetical protein
MSITSVRPMFKSIMNSLGFKEWRSSFEPDNLPKTLIDSSYHLKTDEISGVKQNQNDVELNIPVTITFARKGMRDEISAVESGEEAVQKIVKETLNAPRRLNTQGIVNIVFNRAVPRPIAIGNDNITLFEVQFTCFVILGV